MPGMMGLTEKLYPFGKLRRCLSATTITYKGDRRWIWQALLPTSLWDAVKMYARN